MIDPGAWRQVITVRSALPLLPLLIGCEDIRVTLLDSAEVGVDPAAADTAAVDTGGDDTAVLLDTADPGGGDSGDTAVDTGPALPAWSVGEPTRLASRGTLSAAWLSSADLDHDGYEDLVYLDVNSGGTADRLSIWHGTATGLGAGAESAPDTLLYAAILGDLDGDGFVDLIARANEGLVWFPGDGAGFGASKVLGLVESSPLLAVMDLTGDGVDDLVAWTWVKGAYVLQVWSMQGSATPALYVEVEDDAPTDLRAIFAYTVPDSPRSVAILAEVSADPTSSRYLAVDPAAASPASFGTLGLIRAANDVPVAGFGADLDGDGLAEVVTTGSLGLVTWNPATDTRTVARSSDPNTIGAYGLSGVDLDRDGVPDALELLGHYVSTDHSSSSRLQLQPSLADGGLSPLVPAEYDQGPPTMGQFREVLTAADFTGDGCVDAAYLDTSLEPWLAVGVCPTPTP